MLYITLQLAGNNYATNVSLVICYNKRINFIILHIFPYYIHFVKIFAFKNFSINA